MNLLHWRGGGGGAGEEKKETKKVDQPPGQLDIERENRALKRG